jgi:hypothetical protein
LASTRYECPPKAVETRRNADKFTLKSVLNGTADRAGCL